MTLTALDCCAGAGGLSLGLADAGFDVRGVELDADAVATHRAMVGPCDHADLWAYHPGRAYDLVAGGIPCQSHSTAGKRAGTADPRGQLYVPFLRIAAEAGARAVLIENVRGILSSPGAGGGTAFAEVEAAVCAAGYLTAHAVLDAARYGVPQHRRRLFLVGFRDAAARAAFRWPAPTHDAPGNVLGLAPWVTVRQALGLAVDAPSNAVTAREYKDGARGSHGGTARGRGAGYAIGQALASQLSPLDRPCGSITTAAQGIPLGDEEQRQRMARALSALDRPAPAVKANATHEGRSARASQRPWAAVIDALDRPSPCITAAEQKSALAFGSRGALTDPRRAGDTLNPALAAAGHHTSNKAGAVRLTVAQLATLQGFPPGFVFTGNTGAQHRAVGNAVPPALGAAVGRAIAAALLASEVAYAAAV